MSTVRTRTIKSSSSVMVPDDAFTRALKRIKGMNKSERIDSLKNAGILTPGGNLAKPYRVLGAKALV